MDTTVPRGPRVYDYWLGGANNFPADRVVAEQVLQFMPEILDSVRGNRKFLGRAVAFMRDAGVRQFLDIGCGLPNSPNVHEIAQEGGTGARVVYVDHDPEVTSHAQELTAGNDLTAVVRADLRADREVLGGAARLLDFTLPVGLLFAGCLHHIPDSDDPAGVVARYLAALAPGSNLLVSQLTGEFAPDRMQVNANLADGADSMLEPGCLCREVCGWRHAEQAPAVWKCALLDAGTPAHAENPAELAPRPGRDASGRDPPPPRGLRGAHVETADHDNAGLRVKLAAVFQRHRHFGKLRDAEELVV
jgi:SAM-dependent methyltransferase